MNRQEITAVVMRVILDYLDTLEEKVEVGLNPETRLIGRNGLLDSLGLVDVLVELEEQLQDRGLTLSLATEKAVSRERSPFRTVGTLVEYIEEQASARHG